MRTSLFFVLALLLTGSVMLASDFEGAYTFVRVDTPSGPNTTQKGLMIVKDGYICHLRVNKERDKMVEEDSEEVRNKKMIAAYRAATASCGSYTASGKTVTAEWMTDLNPGVEGHKSEFTFEMNGNQLTVAPASSPDVKFVYERVK